MFASSEKKHGKKIIKDKVTDDVKLEIEKIVATPEYFDSFFGIDYKNSVHPAV